MSSYLFFFSFSSAFLIAFSDMPIPQTIENLFLIIRANEPLPFPKSSNLFHGLINQIHSGKQVVSHRTCLFIFILNVFSFCVNLSNAIIITIPLIKRQAPNILENKFDSGMVIELRNL